MADFSAPQPHPNGLPPVELPSGRLIAQLFIIPLGIVVGAVAVFFTFSWLVAGSRTPQGFLDGLRNSNPEVRWRAASDLAQTLPRDDALASDPQFGLDLTALLNDSLAAMRKPAPPPVDPRDGDANRRSVAQRRQQFLAQRSEAQYLTASLGSLITPVGATVLGELAAKPISPDDKTDALLRRQAVWALARLGNGRQRFDKLPAERRDQILGELDRLSHSAGENGAWAKGAAEALRNQGTAGVVPALVKAAGSDDPYLRKQAALALTFWIGAPGDNLRAEQALLKLTRDDGHGRSIEVTERD